ncbi:hypothetical protein BN14_12415 [Rhizoctonia solani AG-1 IB]|uniref:Uncharacterized protein n=1 Tax=Thanatephorus cucumeris (strain AG1-IB / isolate 7/3/14) TaxID=1108050 RepID=M5CHP9_THACB|nr:hypothetical protein BN14_12415 [Rhizoctonia solani AG-1 IB]
MEPFNTRTEEGKKNAIAIKKSPGFIKYKAGFNNFKRGAVRFLAGYKVLGSIVLICPLLDFASFKDPVMGARINGLLPDIKEMRMRDPERVKQQADTYEELMEAIFEKLPTKKEFMDTLEDIKSFEEPTE